MFLKKIIENEIKKSGYEADANLSSLVLFNLSQHDYFKNIYEHFSIAKINDNLRIHSPFFNSVPDISTSIIEEQLLNPFHEKYDDICESETPKNVEIYIDDFKCKSVHYIYNIIEKSDNLSEVINALSSIDHNDFLYFEQYFVQRIDEYKKSKISDIFEIVKSLILFETKNKFYCLKNDEVVIDSYIANSIFGLKNYNNFKDDFKNTFNNSEFYELKPLLIDQELNEVPKDIIEIIKNKDKDNIKAISKYNSFRSYKNKLLSILKLKSVKKDFKISEYFFIEFQKKINQFDKDFVKLIKPLSTLNYDKKLIQKISDNISHQYLNNDCYIEIIMKNYVKNENKKESDLNSDIWLRFYNDAYNDNAIKGFNYINEDSLGFLSIDNSIISLRNNNELIGFLAFEIKDDLIKINNINISFKWRGRSLVEKLYKKLIEFSIKENKMICSTCYSNMGADILPKIKTKLTEEHKDCFWIHTSRNSKNSELDIFIIELNSFIENQIKNSHKKYIFSNVRLKYDTEINKINDLDLNEIFKNYYLKEELIEELLNKIL